jgi:hypothetical protein
MRLRINAEQVENATDHAMSQLGPDRTGPCVFDSTRLWASLACLPVSSRCDYLHLYISIIDRLAM